MENSGYNGEVCTTPIGTTVAMDGDHLMSNRSCRKQLYPRSDLNHIQRSSDKPQVGKLYLDTKTNMVCI